MGLGDVRDALEHAEHVMNDVPEQRQTIEPSLQGLESDADVQLRKACALLNACRDLQYGDGGYIVVVELSFNAVERTFQHYLLDTTGADSSTFHDHRSVFDTMQEENVFAGEAVVDRVWALRDEHRPKQYYDTAKPTAEQAEAMLTLAREIHDFVVDLGNHHSRCACD